MFRYLAKLQDRPQALQEKVFQKLFEAAEIAKFSKEEKKRYEESLKYYRDIKNVVDTAKEEEKIEIAKKLKNEGASPELISTVTGLSIEQIKIL